MARKSSEVVISLKRGLDLLRAYQAEDQVLNNSELVERTGLPKSTVTRFSHTLTQLGYLQTVERLGSYRLGNRVVPLGQKLLATLPICPLARPLMQVFADEHSVSVALTAPDQTSMVSLVHCSGHSSAIQRLRTGTLLSMAHSAVGRAYLWAQRPARRSEHFAQIAAEAGEAADRQLPDITESFYMLDEQGFYCMPKEWHAQPLSLAVPLIVGRDETVLALGCSLTRQRPDPDGTCEALGPALVQLGAQIASTISDLSLTFWED